MFLLGCECMCDRGLHLMSSSITLIFILLLFFDTESFTGLSACQFAYTGHPMNSRDPPAFATTDLRLQVDAAKPHLNAEE